MPNREMFSLRFSQPQMSADGSEAEVMLYGEIILDMPEAWKWSKEDKSAADFDKAIKDVRGKGAKKINLRINSPGGIIVEAVAMRSILANAGFEEINIHIEGLCASAATLIATIPNATVYISEGSEYMIHNPWNIGWGTAKDFEQEAKHLRMEEANARAMYKKKCGREEDAIQKWMDDETWFSAKDAVKYGFADKLVEASNSQKIAACVSPRVMNTMRALYSKIPESVAVAETEGGNDPVSPDTPTVAAGGSTEYTPEANQTPSAQGAGTDEKDKEDKKTMAEIKDVTQEQLAAENKALHDSLMKAGAEAERARIQEIDDLTPAGYESMAIQAKQDGTSAMDYHKQIVAAQRKKAAEFVDHRKEETAASAQVKGGASVDGDKKTIDDELAKSAKEVAEYAKNSRAEIGGGMY